MGMNNFTDGNILTANKLDNTNKGLIKQLFYLRWRQNDSNNDSENWLKLTNFNGYANQSTTTAMWKNGTIFFANVRERFNDQSINPNLWNTSSTTNAGVEEVDTGKNGRIQVWAGGPADVSENASAIRNGTDAKDYKTNSNDFIILVDYETVNGYSANNAKLQISDGTNHIDIETTIGFSRKVVKIVVDKSSETCDYYNDATNTTPTTSGIDLSSLTNWYIRIYISINNGGDKSYTRIYSLADLGIVSGSSTYETTSKSISSSSSIICHSEISGTDVSSSKKVSLDGGTNYKDFENFLIINPTAGSSLTFKYTADHLTSIDGTGTIDVPHLTDPIYAFYD